MKTSLKYVWTGKKQSAGWSNYLTGLKKKKDESQYVLLLTCICIQIFGKIQKYSKCLFVGSRGNCGVSAWRMAKDCKEKKFFSKHVCIYIHTHIDIHSNICVYIYLHKILAS